MIPHLPEAPSSDATTLSFLGALRTSGFEGDLSTSDADRIVLATDNSVYRLVPAALVFPRSTADLVCIARLLATGYSCRSQAKRLDGAALPHPAQALLAALRAAEATTVPAPKPIPA
jgi:hypothetical protein